MSDAIIEAAGWTMLHFLWQGAAIAMVLALVLRLKLSPQARYVAGCLALVAMVASVALTFGAGGRRPPDGVGTTFESPPELASAPMPGVCPTLESPPELASSPMPSGRRHPPGPGATFASQLHFHHCRPCHLSTADSDAAGGEAIFLSSVAPPPPPPASAVKETNHLPPAFPWLVRLWLLGVALLSLRFLLSWLAAGRIGSRPWSPASAELSNSLRRVAEQMGSSRPVRLALSTAVTVPTVLGWLRPLILLPPAAVAGLSASQLEAILAHELAHIRRHDVLVNLLQHAIETLLFFHPAVWWVSRKIRDEREHCCDDLAVSASGGVLSYARALTVLEDMRGASLALGMAATSGSLLDRIRRLAGQERQRQPMGLFPVLLMVAALAIPVAALRSAEPKPGPEQAPRVAAKPIPSAEAAKGLRHLLAKEPEKGIPYTDFTILARSLSDEDLVALLDEIGRKRDGYHSWTRSALYADWARRDLDAALAHYKAKKHHRTWSQDILLALFEGSRPAEPEAALDYLFGLPDDQRFRPNNNPRSTILVQPGNDWVKEATRGIFAELSAMDPERAWKRLPGRNGDRPLPLDHNAMMSEMYHYVAMVEGFFAGLKDAKSVEAFLERFGPVGGPGTEPLGIVIAKVWMTHDPEAALAWAPPQRNDPHVANLLHGVDGNAAAQWATEHPGQALEAFRTNALPNWRRLIAVRLLIGDPFLAQEFVEAVAADPELDAAYARALLNSAIIAFELPRYTVRFPEARRAQFPAVENAPPEPFLEAIKHEMFTEEDREVIRKSLEARAGN